MPKAQNVVLTRSQAACLFALRQGSETQPRIAVEAKLTLAKTAATLRTVARLGLAEQDSTKRWRATSRGRVCRFETAPDRARQNSGLPGPAGRRVLELLDRPMRGREIVEKLGMTPQGVRQLLIKLYAQEHVRFADPENPFWFVSRANDKTSLLSRDEERVLSVIPRDYATDASKIRLASGASEGEVHRALERLLVRRFIEVSDGPWEKRIYRITGAGLKHPQYARSARCAQALRLPVESDRIRNVLSIIMNSGEVRIKEVTNALSLPPRSMNALMQYLKRRHLVKKSGRAPNSPYSLTAEGLATLAEMTRRQAA
jgi:DNA-binding IclR family transcriptional regulator/DNA-binding MarR family transcriptional regulator